MFNKTKPAKSSDTQKQPLMPTESNNGIDKNNKIILYPHESNFSTHNTKNSVTEKFQQLSLRSKATIIAIAIATLPVLGFGILSYLIASKSIENKFTQSQQSETEGLADKVSRFMVERYSNVQVLANLPTFSSRRIRESVSSQEKQAVLDKIVETSKVYDSIAVVDLDGNVMVQSKGSVIPSNIGDRDYIKAVKRDDRPYISQPQLSPSSNKLSIYTVSPVKDNVSNETVAILRARMPVQSLENVIQNYGEAGRKYSIADANGKVFVASKKDQVGKNINTQKLGGDEVVSSASTTTVQGLPDLKWKAVLATNKATAFDAQRQLLLTTVIGTGLTALLVAILAYLLAKRATEPIINATAAVARLGEGELHTRLEVERGDELGVLGANINQMAEQMQALLKKQQLDAERAKLLAEITLKIRQTLQYDEITKTAVREIRQALSADRVVFYQFNPQTFEGTVVSESVVAGYPKMTGVEIDDPCFRDRHAETYKDGRVRVIYNIYNDPSLKNAACYIKMLEKFVVKANLIAPIIKQKQLIGLLIAHQCDGPRQWESSDIEFFRQLAIQIGYAVEQAQLLETVEKGKMVAEKSSEDERHQKEALQMQLLELLSEVEGAASGDLTVRADVTAGEIGTVADFFNSIVESLREIVTQVQQTAIKVNDSININSGAINQLADEALEQAAEINRTLSAVDSMTKDMQAVAQNAQKAAHVTNTARNTASKSGMAMDMTVQNILSLRETVGETAKKVKRLGESTQQISRVVALINQISMQTNLLAINAGIEAARAGEEGQGFIVVAEEVGELAARSAAATKEIEQIVENIQRETSEVVQAMELGTTQVVEGTHIVEDAKSSLNQILEVSRQIDALVQSISNATASQLETSSTVSELMKQIAASSQRTSTSSRQVSQSLQQTVAISEQLQSTVGTFKVN